MSRPAIGLLTAVFAVASLSLAASAFAQGEQLHDPLPNCKYYTKTQQDFEQGLPYCEQCIKDEPENPEARFFGAWCLAEMGRWDEAWESFGWLLDRKNSKDKNTRKHAKMAAERVSGYFGEHWNKGLAALKQGEDHYAEAEQEFTIASKINPRQAAAFLNLGFVRNQLGDTEGALEAFRKAIEVDPENATAYEYYSVALGNKRDKMLEDEANADPEALAEITAELKTVLERVITDKPANDAALLQLGDIALRAGEQDKAIEYINRGIDVDPNNVVKLFNIAVGFFQSKDYEAAAETFAMVAEREDDPDSDLWTDSMYYGALSLFKNGQVDESLVLVKELLEVNPEEKDYHSLAIQLYLKKGEIANANEHTLKYEELEAAEGGAYEGGAP
ncbi:tetratricopeptide repeat protein [bacterium]|nr:tetratricopeptide repeat protein [bacterium]